ncbi:MAG: DUF6079 family protein [Pyrinomonadaceae bacterium]
MKRVTEKVRDIVEVCPFTKLHDFAADPALTLASYHFTDITADLMAKWIDRISGVEPGQGTALALAGFRGVGKSHFLAVIGAIIGHPELRSRISDQHVETSAERLSRRHGQCAFVRRGSGTSLLDELKQAIAELLAVSPSSLDDSLHDLLLRGSEQAGELPLVILIDTASSRGSRVARDDGRLLSDISEAAKTLGIFVGVALDDDISGADGANSSIAANYTIDYLDQEHLYKIVDAYIFSKHSQMLPVLHDIYEYYREVLPGFRWSEQRFSSLYPLHPATLEIAPVIRLYIHDFALLGFAAEAGVKILGRPANSLIGVDEIFDSVENKLRSVPDLKDGFAAFDKIEQDVISKTPVQFRLPAKLILKGLLMLSLNGHGSSASEIAASMMIFDDSTTGVARLDVAALLESFAQQLPTSIEKIDRENGDAKYCFRMSAKDSDNDVLTEAAKEISDDLVWKTLLHQTAERFSDIEPSNEFGTHPTPCSVEWRGAIRRGEIVWSDERASADKVGELSDWMIVLERSSVSGAAQPSHTIIWKTAELTVDEGDTVRRHYLLHNNPEVRERFGEGLLTAIQVSSIAIDKVWQRAFMLDGVWIADDIEYPFTEDANWVHSLNRLISMMLAPILNSQYPEHPEFSQLLSITLASDLIANFFSGADANSADIQKLAEDLALPLGLAEKQGDIYVPTVSDDLLDLKIIGPMFNDGGSDACRVIPLAEIMSYFQSPPLGFTAEAQHLILAALVAQRQFEFVTSSGNRINHRSLDLQIIWDDIVGIAKPLNELYAPARLLLWAKLITGHAALKSLDRSEDQLLIIDSLSGWLSGWKKSRALIEFDELPDEHLNAAIWKTAANLRKSFGAMAETIVVLVKNEISLGQCLHTIADLFSDSETEFENKKNDLRILSDYTVGETRRGQIDNYLSLCEVTDDDEIERSRHALLGLLGPRKQQAEQLWVEFKKLYTAYYAEKHDAIMNSTPSGETLKVILRSPEWAAFESFSETAWFDQLYLFRAKTLIRELRQLYCYANVRESLTTTPFCTCSFSLSQSERLADLLNQLQTTVSQGLKSFKTKIIENMDRLISAADTDAMSSSVRMIVESFDEKGLFSSMNSQDIRILNLAAERLIEVEPDMRNANSQSLEKLDEMFADRSHAWKPEIEIVDIYANTKI